MHEVSELLTAWNGFYVMIGSSAAALTGLMFVVISLASGNRSTSTPDGISTFSTPTVYHFCSALFTAAVGAAPFHSLVPLTVLFGLNGIAGMVYVVWVAVSASRIETYRPDAEDWTFHVVLPLLSYLTFVGSAIAFHSAAEAALFAAAGAVIALVFTGIHNAWDVVTFIALREAARDSDGGAEAKKNDTP